MKKNEVTIKRGLTNTTRAVVYLMGFAVFAVNTILLPELAREEAAGRVNPPITYPFFVGAWILSLPIFFALYQAHKLLQYIDNNEAFSDASVQTLRYIKYCAIVFGILIAASAISMIVIGRMVDPTEDTPPIGILGTILTLTSTIIATFVAVLQKLLKDVIAVKAENDLIV